MPIFVYKGKNRLGNIIDGERNVRSKKELVEALEKEQIQILQVERKKSYY